MTRDAAGTVTSSSTIPTETGARGEDVFLFDDGTLAILRLEPLRVDWRSPTGVWTRGAPLPLVGAAVTAADRAAAARQRENMEKAWKEAGIPFPAARPMPPTMPALDAARPLPLPDGRLALKRRSPASATDVRYVIVNRKGTIDGEITLAKGEALLGFGMRSVYISFKDADDVQRLRRHPWP